MRASAGELSKLFLSAISACFVILFPATSQASDPPPISAYGSLPAMDSPELSPDGTMVAYIAPVNGRRCVRVDYLDQAKPSLALCPGPDELQSFQWKTNAHVIFVAHSVNDGMVERQFNNVDILLVADITTGAVRPLIGICQFEDIFESDPEHILAMPCAKYFTNLHGPLFPTWLPDVASINIENGSQTRLFVSEENALGWQTDGRGHVVFEYRQAKPQTVKNLGADHIEITVESTPFYRENAADRFAPVKGAEVFGGTNFRVVGFGDTPDLVYAEPSAPQFFQAIYLFNPLQGRIVDRFAAPDGYDVDDLITSHGHVVGYEYTTDEQQQIFTDPTWKHMAEAVQKALPASHTYLVDATQDERHFLVLAAGGNHPGSYYVLDFSSAAKATLSPINDVRPSVPDTWLAPVKPIIYHARDGLQIHGYLTLPPQASSGPIPFVVLPHGGPSARDSLHFDYLAQMIASRGIGVLQPNFRGSNGYGTAFEAAGFQGWGRTMENDVIDGTKWLIDQKYADPARICIVGWSYGGYAALMGAIREPSLYRCVASMAGVTDMKRYLNDNLTATGVVPVLTGDDSTIDDNSPVANADNIQMPVFLAHGRSDVNVPVEDTEKMEKALKRAGKQVTAIYFDNADHYLLREADRIRFLTELDKFLEANLSPGGTAIPRESTP